MLPQPIVCAICHRGPSWHSTYKQDAAGNVVYGGTCYSLARPNLQRGIMTPQGYDALRAMVRAHSERTVR